MPLVPPGPAEDREIGDRHLVAGGELHLAEALVEDAIEPPRLLHIAFEAVAAVLCLLNLQEMVHLAGHWPEPAHLPHQPFEHRHLAPHVALRPELAGLLAEIDQDRARLEDADRLAARALAVDDRRDLAVRADLDEVGLELVALADIDRVDRIGQRHFFERDADLAAVRRTPGVQYNGHLPNLLLFVRNWPAALPRCRDAARCKTPLPNCHCERSEAISLRLMLCPPGDCFVASLLAMTMRRIGRYYDTARGSGDTDGLAAGTGRAARARAPGARTRRRRQGQAPARRRQAHDTRAHRRARRSRQLSRDR